MVIDGALSRETARDANSLANALRESLASAIIHVSAEEEVRAMSPEAARLLGVVNGNATGGVGQLPPPLLALARQGLAGCAANGCRLEFSVDDRPVVVDVSVVPLVRGSERQGALLVLNDTNAATQIQTHLHEVNRLANAGSLAASMAHEIKNALVAGRTFIDLLLEKHEDAELADVVRKEMSRIDTIVTQMLRLASPGAVPAPFQPVRAHQVLDYAVRLVQPELENRGIALEREYSATPDVVHGRECELQQAALNLLINAMEALGQGGKISLRTELAQANKDGEPSRIRLRIADTGAGIPADHLAHIFEPFFTTKPTGTGLGLAITRQIIDEHGGRIGVQCEPGHGTSFEIVLPAVA